MPFPNVNWPALDGVLNVLFIVERGPCSAVLPGISAMPCYYYYDYDYIGAHPITAWHGVALISTSLVFCFTDSLFQLFVFLFDSCEIRSSVLQSP